VDIRCNIVNASINMFNVLFVGHTYTIPAARCLVNLLLSIDKMETLGLLFR
jgi:hypothetical protein